MSWTGFNFDVFTPKVYGTLTTSNMIYKNSSTKSMSGVCESPCGDYMDLSCSDGNGHPTCFPSNLKNQCGSQSSITLTYPEATCPLDDNGYCSPNNDNDCPKIGHDQQQSTYCTITQTQICADINDKQTCTLGSNGIGNCLNDTCVQQTNSSTGANWSSNNTPSSGWIICQYYYDFTQLSYPSYQEFANWLIAVYSTGTSPSAPNGLSSDVRIKIRDVNFVHALVSDFYNQIFNTNFYASNPASNPFSSKDFLSIDIEAYVNGLITDLAGMVFGTTIIPSVFQQSIAQACFLPTVSQYEDTYTLNTSINYFQLQQAVGSSSTLNGYIQDCMNSLLKDNLGIMRQSGTPITTPTLILQNSQVISYSAVQVESNGNSTYSYTTNIPPGAYNSAYYEGYMFATANVSSVIQQWSPMLLLYALSTNPSLTFSEKACSTIASQVYVIPMKCMETCGQSCLQNYCNISYTPPSIINSVLPQQLFFSQDSEKCVCYNSFLVPAGQSPSNGNPGSMCYSNSCDEEMKQLFGLTDQKCTEYCQEVGDWAKDGTMKNPSDFNTGIFNRLCGYIPTTQPVAYNTSVLTTGIVMTILFTMLSFSICKHKNYSTTRTGIIVLLTFSFFGILTGFFSRDLAGVGFCSNNDPGYKFVCQSRISKINLPSYFCNYQEACECVSNSDCPANCNICASTFCIPQSGNRKTETISETKPNVIIIIFSVLSSLIVPLVLIYLHDDYHWIISKKIFSIIAVLIGVIGLVFTIVQARKKYSRVVPVGSCSVVNNTCEPPCSNGEVCNDNNVCVCASNPCLKGNQCGNDDCGNSCGTCSTGYTCNPISRTCIGPVSFTIGYTYQGQQYILTTSVSDPPINLMLTTIQDYNSAPYNYLSTWVYDPFNNTIVLQPREENGWKIYALVAGAQATYGQAYCDPYPTVGGVGYSSSAGQFAQAFGDYGLYVDLYNASTIAQYGEKRFQRWEIFSNGVIQDNSCPVNNGQYGRCIAVYMYQGQPVMTTTSPWELNCTQFNFFPTPPNGTFSEDKPVGAVLACQNRTGTEAGCPEISVDVQGNSNPLYNNDISPVCGSTDSVIASPHPLWSQIQTQMGSAVCGVSPFNGPFQKGCCNYLGDSCFNTEDSTWCNQISKPNQ